MADVVGDLVVDTTINNDKFDAGLAKLENNAKKAANNVDKAAQKVDELRKQLGAAGRRRKRKENQKDRDGIAGNRRCNPENDAAAERRATAAAGIAGGPGQGKRRYRRLHAEAAVSGCIDVESV